MYDSTAVGFLLCMLMTLYKFNNATAVHWGWGGVVVEEGVVLGDDTPKNRPTDHHIGLTRRGVSSEVTDYINLTN